ncbi:acyl-CoA thioesterase [Clostridium sp. ZS2-4]|uniref:acyl-CoA thioesterase n=1 Tax=Clostridium sp. ZS2-4 TaxID=2987703 RepID=UPI00227C07A8|nr:thioesterase family protein [Clostridium sp. ZS2-4]MCY6356226.1 thioesterase family protein [Clostridium sp. ZS2-4]
MFVNKAKVKVRYVETDKMGVVHHSNYYAWFEIGRGEFITESGISYKEIEEEGVMLPLAESSCKYIVGAQYDDNLIIETSIKELNAVKIIFNYNVIRESDSKLLAKGKTTHAFVNNNFKIINIKKKHPSIWEKLSALYEK